MPDKFQIQIHAPPERVPWRNLIPALEALLPVKFRFSTDSGAARAGDILMEDGLKSCGTGKAPSISSFKIPRNGAPAENGQLLNREIIFVDHPNVPFPFRGRLLRTKLAARPQALSLDRNGTLLASSDEGPVWAVSEQEGRKHFESGIAPPAIPPGGDLQDVLNGNRFFELLPLLHWLHETGSGASYQGPSLRACFMFDDPNLHWPRYGFVDYGEIAAHAEAENYHVSFATIPLDAWYTHKKTAALFRNNPARLSLAVHGNNHTKKELAGNYTPDQRMSLLSQAVRRVERVEHASALSINRVMVPPHGACSQEMLAALPDCGFEAACISHSSLRSHNRSRDWTGTLGYLPSEIVAGCPVMPRWGLDGNVEDTILLAAYLGQPIILRGHQEDLRNGVGLLDRFGRFINRLGSVRWSNLADLSRANYFWKMDGGIVRIKPRARKLNLQIPEGASHLVIEQSNGFDLPNWRIVCAGVESQVQAGECVPLPDRSNATVGLHVIRKDPHPALNGCHFPNRRAMIRRLLTESRDRFL